MYWKCENESEKTEPNLILKGIGMGYIKILDESVSNIIAAGEVVENPASMIKEMIENSLDAKATVIKIEVFKGGTEVKINDNGIGKGGYPSFNWKTCHFKNFHKGWCFQPSDVWIQGRSPCVNSGSLKTDYYHKDGCK